MKIIGVSLFAAILFAGNAAAATGWTTRDITRAVQALHYPKPGMRRLACKPSGAGFKCAATYARHKTRRFYIAPRNAGGWLCAGTKPSTCALLKHGFATTAAVNGNLAFNSRTVAIGYIQNKSGQYPTYSTPCLQGSKPSIWSCGFESPNVTVTVTYTAARGGYVTSATG